MLLISFDLDKREVDAEVMAAVTELLDWQYVVRLSLAPIRGLTNEARSEEAILKELRSGPLTYREMVRKRMPDQYGQRVFDEALIRLSQAGRIVKVPGGKAGRTEAYKLADI